VALDDDRHPEAERLAEYADGLLGAAMCAEVEAHLMNCPDCRAVLAETRAPFAVGRDQFQKIEATPGPRVLPFRIRRLATGVAAGLAAAAALVAVMRIARPQLDAPVFSVQGNRRALQELIAAVANEPTRPIEGRLSGGFKYAPPSSPTRGAGDREASPDVRIAAAKIETLAKASDTPDNQALLGVAHLALGDFDTAITLLGAAAAARPLIASIQSDLAAAFLERAARGRSRDDFESARLAADRALAIDPANAQAAFNRALALEGLGADEAREAWTKARAQQQDVGWRAEADSHIAGR